MMYCANEISDSFICNVQKLINDLEKVDGQEIEHKLHQTKRTSQIFYKFFSDSEGATCVYLRLLVLQQMLNYQTKTVNAAGCLVRRDPLLAHSPLF